MSHIQYHRRLLSCYAAACTMLSGTALAQDSSSASIHPRPAPVASAVRREGPIVIDGKLDESAWAAAHVFSDFRQSVPTEGAAPTVRTEIRILYDADALYIGARMYDPVGASGIRAPLARRDQLLDGNNNNGAFNSLTSDKLIVTLDPYHNHIDEALFEINPAGVRGDSFSGDDSWDPIWEGASAVDSLGWTAEMRIPYSQLRFSRDTLQTWGLQVMRYADRINEHDMWAFWHNNEGGGAPFFGHLTGLEIHNRPHSLELLPYVETRSQFQYAAPGDPFHKSDQEQVRGGADVKYGITSNLTLDATFNPDFGQVEVDPATLNLSAFETYFDEKRPFFIAGSSAFSFGGSSCMFCSNFSGLQAFYSRRIGRVPQLNQYVASDAVFSDLPDNTTIIGAGKVTGRTAGGYTVGLLDAVTNKESADYRLAPAGPDFTQSVEPLTNYFVGRVKKDYRDGATTVGLIGTSTVRRLDGDTLLTAQLHTHAEEAGFDFIHAWDRQNYQWRGSFLASSVEGSPESLFLTQEASAHYYQRPDRRVTSDGLFGTRYDSGATPMRGYGFYTRVSKENGDWRWEAMTNVRSPGFEVNDISFLDRADYKYFGGNVMRQWTTPGKYYRDMLVIAGGSEQFNYDGDRNDEQAQSFYQITFPNYWRVRTFGIYHPTVDDDRLTRGGPVVKRTGYDLGDFEIATDARGRAVFNVVTQFAKGIDGARTHTFQLSPGVAFKPIASVFVSLSPSYIGDEDAAQYVTTVADPTATSFYGNRYVFSYIRTKTISLDTRVNWTFTPNLTLQLYAQPFVATGDYGSFREFAAPRSVQKLVYGKDIGTITRTPGTSGSAATYTIDPDGAGPAKSFTIDDPSFTYTSLRGNAVLRWEYRPGSTVFFVWTQNRTGNDAVGTFDFTRARGDLFRDRPSNVFQIKVNYWLGR